MEQRVIKFLRTVGMLIGILYGAIFISALYLVVTGETLDYSIGYFDFAFIMGSIGLSLAISFKSTPITEQKEISR